MSRAGGHVVAPVLLLVALAGRSHEGPATVLPLAQACPSSGCGHGGADPIASSSAQDIPTTAGAPGEALRCARGTGAIAGATALASPVKIDAEVYANCAALNAVYPHGVGRPGAVDHTSGRPVTGFAPLSAIYAANPDLDRDKDGIACERDPASPGGTTSPPQPSSSAPRPTRTTPPPQPTTTTPPPTTTTSTPPPSPTATAQP